MKKQQQGAALFVVMALLSASMVVGMTAMQSSLVDERLAGNFRSSVQAQMTAENTLSSLVNPVNTTNRNDFLGQLVANPQLLEETGGKLTGDAIAQLLQAGTLDEFIEDLLPANFDELEEEDQRQIKEALLANLELQFEVNTEEQTVTITSWDRGLRNSAARDSAIIYSYSRRETDSASWRQYQRGFIACEGMRVGGMRGGGSAEFNSFNSQVEGGINQKTGNAYLSTREEGADVFLTGNGRINGKVYSTGDLVFSSSSIVSGDAYINGLADFSGNYNALVNGDVVAEAAVGNRRKVRDHVGGELLLRSGGAGLEELEATASCDEQGVVGLYEKYLNETGISSSGDISITDWNISEATVLSSEGLYDPHPEYSGDYVEVEGLNGESVVRVDNFKLAGSRVFQVGTKESPANIVMLVEQDFEISGGSKFIIEDGSSLTVIVKGKFLLKGGRKIEVEGNGLVVDDEEEPRAAFSLVSLYDDSLNEEGENAGVYVSGESTYYGEILAPYSHVNFVGSSHLYGSVYSRKLSVEGNNKFYHDEALGVFGVGLKEDAWCSFDDLSPLTIASPVDNLFLPNSQAEFNGKGSVPDITVTQGDLERFSSANAANDNIQGGIPDGLFSRGESAEKFHAFIEMIRTRSDTVQVQGGSVRNNTSFGSKGNEQITFVNGTINANNISGAGVLVVKGNYDAGGNPEFDGLIIVLGNYSQKGGGGRDLNGALLVAPYNASNLTFASANIEFSGGGSNDFNYDEEALRTAFNLLNDEEQASWGSCNAPPASGNGELTWSLSGWR
ncbi:pilus assembly PilX N-terminal domain-containing protein [Halomonas sp. LC1]|uniref:pilus assembly PilX N-terminal domain-containing protein n=1 Tax=Halomonas sp. LC1 TaxID=3043733 RepID=UPI002553F478|nr:pilus assembly PilX N-terminal domain-containing protein [Halomonas sp. LC1]MDK9687665.1 pilus assembly PilX N-terminal domain-containing protein [Halomonas sp. LC1]